MWLDVLRRVRWGNVALALAVATLMVVGIVRPLTAPPSSPRLPPDRAVPVLPSVDTPDIAERPREPAAREQKQKPPRKLKRPARKRRRASKHPRVRHAPPSRPKTRDSHRRARPPAEHAADRATDEAVDRPAVQAAPTITATPRRRAGPRPATSTEFNFEGG